MVFVGRWGKACDLPAAQQVHVRCMVCLSVVGVRPLNITLEDHVRSLWIGVWFN